MFYLKKWLHNYQYVNKLETSYAFEKHTTLILKLSLLCSKRPVENILMYFQEENKLLINPKGKLGR